MKAALITLAAIVGIGLMGLCMVMSSKNSAINLEEQVNTAKSGIDVQLSNRFNKLHELAACVKKYDEHEYNTLLKVIEARTCLERKPSSASQRSPGLRSVILS